MPPINVGRLGVPAPDCRIQYICNIRPPPCGNPALRDFYSPSPPALPRKRQVNAASPQHRPVLTHAHRFRYRVRNTLCSARTCSAAPTRSRWRSIGRRSRPFRLSGPSASGQINRDGTTIRRYGQASSRKAQWRAIRPLVRRPSDSLARAMLRSRHSRILMKLR